MGRADLAADATYTKQADRYTHQEALDAAISAWTKDLTPYQVQERLQAVGVPAGAVLQDVGEPVAQGRLVAHVPGLHRPFEPVRIGIGAYRISRRQPGQQCQRIAAHVLVLMVVHMIMLVAMIGAFVGIYTQIGRAHV